MTGRKEVTDSSVSNTPRSGREKREKLEREREREPARETEREEK